MTRLTKKQADLFEWALDAMTDFWVGEAAAEERESGTVYTEEALPLLEGDRLQLDHVPEEILKDLLERVEDQAPGMASGADTWQEASGAVRIAENLGAKIRER